MNLKKIINKFNLFVLIFFLFSKVAYALNCDFQAGSPPDFSTMICPIYRIINFLLAAGGIILAIMLGFGAIKFSVALGDPKGLEGGKKTLTYAVVGFAVVVGALVILAVIYRLIAGEGLLTNIPNLQDIFRQRLCDFMDMLWISNDINCP